MMPISNGAGGWESLDKELQQLDPDSETGRRYVDKLVKVWLKNGEEQWVLIHVEVQMSDETEFPLRMYIYNYRVFDKYNRREVASFAVLGDDNPHWRPDRVSFTGGGVWKPGSASRSSSSWITQNDAWSWRKAPIPSPRWFWPIWIPRRPARTRASGKTGSSG